MKKTSIADIAKQLGLSKTTVSFVLNHKGDEKKISVQTQQRIFALAGKLNYQPDSVAQSLKTGRSNTIGYLVPDIANPFFARIGRKIEDLLADDGYNLIIGSTDENASKETALINTLVSRKTDGLIIASTSIRSKTISHLLLKNFPLVLFDREDPEIKANYIVVENKSSMKNAVAELVTSGHRKIGLLSITPQVYSLKLRIEGFREAMQSVPDYDPHLIRTVNYSDIKQSTHKEIRKLMEHKVDAIVFTNNLIATEGLWVLNRFYKDHIGQLALLSFDDSEIFDYALPRVTSLSQPVNEIAIKTVEILLKQINEPASNFSRIELQTSLIKR
jgi:LacI family transcriptional regulator